MSEADRAAFQEVARLAREAASRTDVGASAGALLEAVADLLTVRDQEVAA